MEDTIIIYYTFCSQKENIPGSYLKYQREIADKILNYSLKKHFHMMFDRDKVKRGSHGKPYWSGEEDMWFNVSNTEGLVVCAIASLEIGVDAERLRGVRLPVIRRSCSQKEVNYILDGKEAFLEQSKELLGELEQERFFRIWTLKESYIKMTGDGMSFPLQEAEFLIKEKKNGKTDITCSQAGYFIQRKIADYWVSVCGSQQAEVVWQEISI